MRISFDMDGVLADMDGALAQLASQEFGKGSSAAPPPAALGELTAKQQARLWTRVRETRNFWETLKECEPGIVRRLQHVAHLRRWDVLFVTQRPGTTGRTQQLQTQHWLRRHGFEYPAVYTTEGSRGRIAAALTLDVHVDDRLENCVDVASDSKAWPILVWRDGPSLSQVASNAAKLKIAAVLSVGEALDKLEQTERRVAEQPGLLARLKRSFMGRS